MSEERRMKDDDVEESPRVKGLCRVVPTRPDRPITVLCDLTCLYDRCLTRQKKSIPAAWILIPAADPVLRDDQSLLNQTEAVDT
ncbi:hypothetical protein INR49_006903 [Caranx melampygus]|nr:hypothetical protein INR49_006903 [Caranx melampygus]